MRLARRWGLFAGALGLGSGCGDSRGQNPPPCDVPGTICTWMGKPQVALLSAEGLDRQREGLYLVQDISFGADGAASVADFNNHRILRVGDDDRSDTLTGTGVPGDGPRDGGSCAGGCVAHSTDIWHPSQIAADPNQPEVLYAALWQNHRLVRVDVARDEITWLVGDGEAGYSDDPPRLSYPTSVMFGEGGELYFSDQGNQVVRALLPDGTLERVAGQPGIGGYAGDGGPALDAVLHGNTDWVGGPTNKLTRRGSRLVLADTVNGVIRAIDLDRGTIDRVAGRFVEGGVSGSLQGYAGDGGDALEAVFHSPRAVAFGADGRMYVADSGNNCVRVVGTDGIIETFAGRCGPDDGYGGDGGPATDAQLDFPCGVSVDAAGNVYVADSNNHVIRRIAKPSN